MLQCGLHASNATAMAALRDIVRGQLVEVNLVAFSPTGMMDISEVVLALFAAVGQVSLHTRHLYSDNDGLSWSFTHRGRPSSCPPPPQLFPANRRRGVLAPFLGAHLGSVRDLFPARGGKS